MWTCDKIVNRKQMVYFFSAQNTNLNQCITDLRRKVYPQIMSRLGQARICWLMSCFSPHVLVKWKLSTHPVQHNKHAYWVTALPPMSLSLHVPRACPRHWHLKHPLDNRDYLFSRHRKTEVTPTFHMAYSRNVCNDWLFFPLCLTLNCHKVISGPLYPEVLRLRHWTYGHYTVYKAVVTKAHLTN